MKSLVFAFSLLVLGGLSLSSCTKENSSSSADSGGGSKAGSTARFIVVGNYMYTLSSNQLKVVDISNPQSMVVKTVITVGNGMETIYAFNNNLFLGSQNAMFIYNIDNPAQPQFQSTTSTVRRCDPIVVNDTIAYSTLNSTSNCGGNGSRLIIYNVKNVQNPIQLSSTPLNNPLGLDYKGNYLYVCDGTVLKIFNVLDPRNPELENTISFNGAIQYLDPITYGNLLVIWVNQGALIYDITNPVAPQYLSTIN